MSKLREIALESLTAKAFAPFGQVVGEHDGPPVFSGPHIASWRLDFDVEGGTELMFARYVHQPFRLTRMERHFNVTQSFVALGGAASVMVVAAPTDPADPNAYPAPEAVRAFLVGGNRGVLLWKGTWHALTRFPAHPPGADFALITGRATQRELESQNAGGPPPSLTQVVDFEAAFDARFEVVDPGGLLDAGRT